MKITVVGAGYVGLTVSACFAEVGHCVLCLDIDENKISMLKRGISPIYEDGLEDIIKRNMQAGRLAFISQPRDAYQNADAIFLAVATPELPDGSACLKCLYKAAEQAAQNMNQRSLVVIKSTVPAGTNDEIEKFMNAFIKNGIQVEVASNPEFLTQGCAVAGTLHADRIVIGTASEWAESVLKEIYKPFQLPVVSVSRRSAEMIKYACNNFLSLKISYMNEIANLCERTGADIGDVALGMSFDDRIGGKFLNAGIGFGGSCLPKDSAALAYMACKAGLEMKTVRAAIDVNKSQKTILFKKAANIIPSFEKVRIAVLGLTFKPKTGDLREAPSIENVSLLLKKGADVVAWDPVGMESFKKIYAKGKQLNGSIAYAISAKDALAGADACFIFTEWDEFRALTPMDFCNLMKTPIVFDGRNIYTVEDMEKNGVRYYSIGRS
jgi:UDPglucose 6-dehydrogenase